jgi:alpha-N-acetylglucosamine transferase
MTVLPVLYLSRRSQMARLACGSTPAVGSSNITTLASPTNAMATLSLRFRDQFTKLVLWKIAQYKAHIYFDSDTFIVGNIDDLLASHRKLDNEKYRLGVTRDIRASVWQETFNMGVFVVKPSLDEFNRLMALKANRNFKFETTMSEQGFLNVVYKDKHDKWSLIQTCKHKFTHKKPNNGNFSLLRARKKQTFNERVPRLAKKHAEQRRRGATSNIYR